VGQSADSAKNYRSGLLYAFYCNKYYQI